MRVVQIGCPALTRRANQVFGCRSFLLCPTGVGSKQGTRGDWCLEDPLRLGDSAPPPRGGEGTKMKTPSVFGCAESTFPAGAGKERRLGEGEGDFALEFFDGDGDEVVAVGGDDCAPDQFA